MQNSFGVIRGQGKGKNLNRIGVDSRPHCTVVMRPLSYLTELLLLDGKNNGKFKV